MPTSFFVRANWFFTQPGRGRRRQIFGRPMASLPSFDGGGSTISGGGGKTAQPDEGLPTCHRCHGNGEPLSDERAASLMASRAKFQDGTAMTREACLSQIQKRGMSFRICECKYHCPFGGGKDCLNFRCGTPENIAKGKCPLITQSSARLGNNKGGKKWGNFQSVPRNRDIFKRAPVEEQLREPSDRSQADRLSPSTLSSDPLLNALPDVEGAKTNEEHEPQWLRQERHRLQVQQAVQQQQQQQAMQQMMAQQPPQMMQHPPMQQQMYQQPPPMMGQQPPQQVYGEPYAEYPVPLPPRVFDSARRVSYRSSHTRPARLAPTACIFCNR